MTLRLTSQLLASNPCLMMAAIALLRFSSKSHAAETPAWLWLATLPYSQASLSEGDTVGAEQDHPDFGSQHELVVFLLPLIIRLPCW